MYKYKKVLGHFKSFDGLPIYYESRGEQKKKPLVFCYGIGCLMNHWRHQLKSFSKSHQTLVFDYRGHQKTPKPENLETLNFSSFALDLLHLLDHQDIDSAVLIAHSFGGPVITEFASLYPERVSGLVFINSFFENPFSHPKITDSVKSFLDFASAAYSWSPDLIQRLWEFAFSNPLTTPVAGGVGGFNLKLTSRRDIEIYNKGIQSLELNVFIPLFQQMVSASKRAEFLSINKPVLVIAGEQDSLTGHCLESQFLATRPSIESLVIPYGSHCTQLDFPDFVNLRIEKFLLEIGHSGDSET